MSKEEVLVECPGCGASRKFGDMAEQTGVRSSRCPECDTEFSMKESLLSHVLNTNGTWVMGIRTCPKNQQPTAPPAGTAAKEGAAPADADAVIRDAQRKAAASTDQADELPENPLTADARKRAEL